LGTVLTDVVVDVDGVVDLVVIVGVDTVVLEDLVEVGVYAVGVVGDVTP